MHILGANRDNVQHMSTHCALGHTFKSPYQNVSTLRHEFEGSQPNPARIPGASPNPYKRIIGWGQKMRARFVFVLDNLPDYEAPFNASSLTCKFAAAPYHLSSPVQCVLQFAS